ncbi:hypothetical protein [Kitasatospora sp. NBC_01539]|uniref:hypothetical protein n=1 Tax=Kitasatospora sp. NBC_01539 TaxID=2903577 RepID=UPI003860306D
MTTTLPTALDTAPEPAPPADAEATTPGGPAFAAAFRDGATVTPLDLGPHLKGEIRSCTDATVHVLTVRNPTAQVREFLPEDLLPEGTGPLLFLGGRSTSGEREGRITARLEPDSFVQLGRLTDPRPGCPADSPQETS